MGSRKIRSRRSLQSSFLAQSVMTRGVLDAPTLPGRDDTCDFTHLRKSEDLLFGGKVLLVQVDFARCDL
eukprot:10425344-Karenia_brevis.AAC.1